ncbi:MAG: tetratricopeptide repeat protein [Magnetococcales bacterium]|nr:tetratricopeptide repeat protein [Magnetococcales bacterium]
MRDDPAARTQLFAQALARQQAGEYDEAERLYRQILTTFPNDDDTLRNLGLLCLHKGAVDEAITLIERCLTLSPERTPLRLQLADTLLVQKRPAAAAHHFQEILRREPQHAIATYHLGLARQGEGRLEEAIALLRRARTLPEAESGPILASLGAALRAQGDLAAAESCYRAAIDQEPNDPQRHNTLGLLLQEMGRTQEAIETLSTLVANHPRMAMAWNNLGILFRQEGALEGAEMCYHTALRLDPNLFVAENNLAVVLGDMGRVEEAVATCRRALALDPTSAATHSNLILNLHYLPTSDAATLLAECRAYNAQHVAPFVIANPDHCRDRDPHRPLRIGYLSPDFKQHPVGFFWQPVLAAHDRRQFAIHAYSGVGRGDWLTRLLEGAVDCWRPVKGLDDPTLARLISADRIDILVELSGHTDGNRLPLLARRPASIQITGGGHYNTTGVAVIDYLLCDPHHAPPGSEVEFSETPLRLPDDYICYAPPPYAPPVTPLPALTNGCITFGCFNNPIKVTAEVIAVWAEVLRRVPGSCLRMRARGLGDVLTRDRFLKQFHDHGIDGSRLELAGALPHPGLLAAYGAIDIALDPFPYSGGLTTLEALWMGVPVVTLTGKTFCGRHSTSHLHNAGLPQFVTGTREAYVDTIVRLADNREALARLRAGLRAQMARSPLCDGVRYTRNLEAAYRRVWQQWCRS